MAPASLTLSEYRTVEWGECVVCTRWLGIGGAGQESGVAREAYSSLMLASVTDSGAGMTRLVRPTRVEGDRAPATRLSEVGLRGTDGE